MAHEWTDEENAFVKELWLAGKTKYQVADAVTRRFYFPCKPNMISGRVHKMGLVRDKSKLSAAQQKRVALLLISDFGAAA